MDVADIVAGIMDHPLVVEIVQFVAIPGLVLTVMWFCYGFYELCRQRLWSWLDGRPHIFLRNQALQVLLQRIGQQNADNFTVFVFVALALMLWPLSWIYIFAAIKLVHARENRRYTKRLAGR